VHLTFADTPILAGKYTHIALVGNPNSGKTSLFNALTGLNQKVGNFPGVTVDLKVGTAHMEDSGTVEIIDLPGAYSLYPKRADEWVTYDLLLNPEHKEKPDMIVLVADASNLKRNLLFCSQVIDLKLPVVVALTMVDIAKQKGISIDIAALQRELGVPVVAVNPRKNKGVDQLKKVIDLLIQKPMSPARDFVEDAPWGHDAVEALKKEFPGFSDYRALHYASNYEELQLQPETKQRVAKVVEQFPFNKTKTQAEEILQRYARIKQIMNNAVSEPDPRAKERLTEKLDNILLHRKWGYVILLLVLFLLFQSIFWIAQYPMDAIEWVFSKIGGWLNNVLAESWWSDLLINGVVAGLSGVLVFIPQIMILFGLITLIEDTGYMARISFLTDRIMRRAGLNGKSVMPLISGFACAVPAIMSARNIENKKERLLTILITPLMSCSARLPVYTILIGLVIPKKFYLGFLSLQGLVMMALYLLGLVFALIVSWFIKRFIKSKEKSFFILELPSYHPPRWKNALITMVNKARIFVTDAGKIIMIISLVLWFLSSYGPSSRMDQLKKKYETALTANPAAKDEITKSYHAQKLENSYAGILGKSIEPALIPLGYDWKIGIALITSFAAREVFVGTMATLYSVGESDENSLTLRQKMESAVKEDGTKVYTLATGVSLMIFYLLAMQCMSTLVIVKRETGSWKWPLIQLLYMTGLAYVFSLIAYNVLK
jgi:ferrous iron transport protein B